MSLRQNLRLHNPTKSDAMNSVLAVVEKNTRSAMVRNKPKLGIYQHYKGNRYELIDVALHSETREEMAVYCALYKNPSTIFPLS